MAKKVAVKTDKKVQADDAALHEFKHCRRHKCQRGRLKAEPAYTMLKLIVDSVPGSSGRRRMVAQLETEFPREAYSRLSAAMEGMAAAVNRHSGIGGLHEVDAEFDEFGAGKVVMPAVSYARLFLFFQAAEGGAAHDKHQLVGAEIGVDDGTGHWPARPGCDTVATLCYLPYLPDGDSAHGYVWASAQLYHDLCGQFGRMPWLKDMLAAPSPDPLV